MCLALALLFWIEVAGRPRPFFAGISAYGLPVVVIGGGWSAREFVRAAKKRFVYPRTGEVTYSRPPRRQSGASAIVAVVTAAILVILVAKAPEARSWIPIAQGFLVGTVLFAIGYPVGLSRACVEAAFSVILGAAVAWMRLGDIAGDAVYFGGMGAVLIVAGSLALSEYLRRTRPLAGGNEIDKNDVDGNDVDG